jgi:hypothetical protein
VTVRINTRERAANTIRFWLSAMAIEKHFRRAAYHPMRGSIAAIQTQSPASTRGVLDQIYQCI